MNHFVPDFDTSTDDDYVHVNSNSTKPIMGGGEEDELMELLWQNGQVVVQNQRLNNTKKLSSSSSTVSLHAGEEGVAPATSTLHHHEQQRELDQNLFIHEDEMTSWLHYPLRDDDFCSDLLFSASAPTTTTTTMTQTTAAKPPVRNFMNFSRMRGDFTRPSVSKPIVRESTQVKPIATPSSAAAEAEASVSGLTRWTDLTVNRGSDLTRRTDLTVNCGSSSAVAGDGWNTLEVNRKGKAVAEPASEIPGTSSKSEIEPVNIQPETEKTIVDERKRKERETTTIDDTESPSEETNKQGRGRTTCTKRSRAAEVHNLSERKRRDRINERMKALQELIPRCNKSDKASMLDEAIEYMKSLQLQVQMMSMGCGMMPMMYTGMQQQYMAMGMGMGMNQTLPPPTFMPFPNMLAPQRPFPTQTHAPDPSRVYLPNQQYDPTSNQPQFPGYVDPYQQFRNLHTTHPPQFQNQATSYPSSSRVSSSKESEDQGNQTTG